MHVELRLELCCVTSISAEYLSHVQLLEGKQLILLAACISQQELHDKGRCVLSVGLL